MNRLLVGSMVTCCLALGVACGSEDETGTTPVPTLPGPRTGGTGQGASGPGGSTSQGGAAEGGAAQGGAAQGGAAQGGAAQGGAAQGGSSQGGGGAGGAGGSGGAQALGPGSLAFIGANSDIPEGFALVPLVDVPSGTELRFTERAWNEDTDAFEIPEGTATLTLTSMLPAGTVFEVTVTPPSTLAVTPAIGTIVDDATGNWGIAGNGENLFAYVGTNENPTFIAGVAISSPSVWTTDSSTLDGQSSMIPASLSEAAGTITTFTPDNVRYIGSRTGAGTFAAYLALVADEASYETGNAAYVPLRGADFAP